MKRVTIYGIALGAVAFVFAIGVGTAWLLQPKHRVLTQADIDSAVLHTLHTKDLPSRAARAAEAVRESVVLIRSYPPDHPPGPPPAEAARPGKGQRDRSAKSPPSSGQARRAPTDEHAKGKGPGDNHSPGPLPDGRHIGTGVVVTEKGLIITNYHVVAGAHRIEVSFHDGHTAEAALVQAVPEKDLAILQPRSIPDDLPPATLGSSRELVPGSEVVAVGFPFGIGPSVSAGVVSGLDRQFVSPDDKEKLDKLIQFDAAANPGNSGGPLVNMRGEVVGIVTAILNPDQSGNFLGIGFAITIESAGGSVGASPF
ncbi:Trypsin-like serine proteases, typically periplasmic, containing C-terminal PDZ domain [Cupriavidus gilardii J11]|uniref:Trypsin-like serine proteases, typically periplasmic, containing C-terminal PDZ domain n=1 Tax=Cupriavidus gilardii J11 TaxID=936133 RepID=A0A562BU13_9BURK|nr:trypsin-like peptidase domain-containing protein [Cupriavidus gilardii]TWG88654.1 Trypsin-like serine proteases, typically periplasmic, containing C-terminal PDZ domain [Cupriavidus gilardii J11]